MRLGASVVDTGDVFSANLATGEVAAIVLALTVFSVVIGVIIYYIYIVTQTSLRNCKEMLYSVSICLLYADAIVDFIALCYYCAKR